VRIAIDARMAHWGGVGTYTRELLRALARNPDTLGIEHILALRSPADADLESAGLGDAIEWSEVPGSPWSPAANTRLGLAARGRADLFHSLHFPVPIGFDGPLVATIHDLIPLLAPESVPRSSVRAAFAGLVRLAVTQADVVVCVTRSAAETITQRFGADSHFVVIHHGLGLAAPSPVASIDVMARYGLHPGYVLWVGGIKPHKDVPTLVAAHMLLPQELRDRHPLVLAGDDDTVAGRQLKTRLRDSDHGRSGLIRMLGKVELDELAGLYDSAAVFAFPSRIEGFGLPPLEAMAHGVPVVSSRADPMPEVLGDASLYFEPGDARGLAAQLENVLTDPGLARGLRTSGAERVRRYSWERTARETAAAYRLTLAIRG
jgi:glycosyltransferase involved in cell wall biosynthesis